jgi:hypothetical protein
VCQLEFGQEAYVNNFDGFMRYFLTVKTGVLPNVSEVYDTFKQHARSLNVAQAGVEPLVAAIRNYARYFCAMTLGAEPDADLKAAFQELRELKVDVTYPFGFLVCSVPTAVIRTKILISIESAPLFNSTPPNSAIAYPNIYPEFTPLATIICKIYPNWA